MRGRGKRLRLLAGRGREIEGEGRAASRKCFSFDVSSVFSNDGHAYAKPETSAATGTLGGVKGIKDAWKRFGAYADAVILESDGKLVFFPAKTNLEAARVTHFANSPFAIPYNMPKPLHAP